MTKSSFSATNWLIAILLICLPHSASAQEKPTLAVLEFDGFGISAQEVAALSNRLRTNLTQLGTYRIIERGLMQQILLEQDFQLTGCTSDECAVEIGQLLGAQFMLAGTIGKVGSTWTIEMRIVNVQNGEVIRTASYDTRGEVDIVLTEGMGAAARKITGVELEAAPATAATPTLRPAMLDVISDPPGAVLFVDDIDQGSTPARNVSLTPGQAHKITLRLERYHPMDTSLTLETGERSRLNLELAPMNGFMALKGDAGARIKINRQSYGRTPLNQVELLMGTYQLKVTKPEYYPYSTDVTVLYDHITHVDYTLKPKSKSSAVALSFAFPGGGQVYHGYRRGLVYLTSAVALAYLGYSSQIDVNMYHDQYDTRLADYNTESDQVAAAVKADAVQESLDAWTDAENSRNLMLGALGAVWLVNIVDIAF